MGTKKGQYRKTARRAYMPKATDSWLNWPFDFLKNEKKR